MNEQPANPPIVHVNDVIQIAPDEGVRVEFRGKLAFVDEVKSWGVQAYVATFRGDEYENAVTRLSEALYGCMVETEPPDAAP